MRHAWLIVLLASAVGCAATDEEPAPTSAQSALLTSNLEIHQINVGWGSSVFVIGPDGTTVLLEAGNTGDGTAKVVPYLQSLGFLASGGLDYTIAGHQHCDHIGGLDEVVASGYDVELANFYNGSAYTSGCVTEWNDAAKGTTADDPMVPTPGQQIALGDGAILTFVAVNGQIIGGGSVSVTDENDRSIAVLIQHGGFDYLWASDLGGGNVDTACTGRSTSQSDVETAIIQAISPGGAAPLISAGGIDVLNVNHHGSESSTNMNWMNYAQPAVALIGTGAGQSSGWDLPRIDVVEHVLLAQASCITVPAALILQTEEGAPAGSLTSVAGYSVGNIRVTTDGETTFTVSADGQVSQGPSEVALAGLPATLALDEEPPPPPPPTPVVILNEILANEPGSDTAAEAIELVNAGGASIDIGGWTLSDGVGLRHTFAAGTNLVAGGGLVVFGGTASTGSLSLNNTGDTVTLRDAGGATVDTFTYPSGLASVDGVSMNRDPDANATGTWVLHTALAPNASSPGTLATGEPFPDGRSVIAADDFEADFGGGSGWSETAWRVSGDALIRTNADGPHSGSKHARLRKNTGSLKRIVNLAGHTGAQLGVWAKLSSFEATDVARVRVSTNGGASYVAVLTLGVSQADDSYHFYDVDISACDGAAACEIFLDADMSATNDLWFVDDLEVTAF